MKWSRYNYVFCSDKYKWMLYNSESNAFAKLSSELYHKISSYTVGEEYRADLDEETFHTLSEAKVFVEDIDRYFYSRKLRTTLANYDTRYLSLTIAPTLDCNFSCPYCFEKGLNQTYMSDETVDNLLAFIRKYKDVEELSITWYGGEPLLNFRRIKDILGRIQQLPVQLSNHSMVTNGYLLTREKALFFKDYPLNDIQITIDGIKEKHNARRALKNGLPTFDKILSNIDEFTTLNPKTQVVVRVNIDRTNAQDYPQLKKEIATSFASRLVTCYPAFVGDYTNDPCVSCGVLAKEEQLNFYWDLQDKYGMKVNYYASRKDVGCGASRKNSYVVGAEGELYKCWNDIGMAGKVVGHLSKEGPQNINVLAEYLVGPNIFEDTSCRECEIFPICSGGCVWRRIKNEKEGSHYELCNLRKGNLKLFLEKHYENKTKQVSTI